MCVLHGENLSVDIGPSVKDLERERERERGKEGEKERRREREAVSGGSPKDKREEVV